MHHRMRLAITAILVVSIFALVSAAADNPSDGERWLNWSEESRVAYVEGFLWGFEGGFFAGCEAGEKTYSAKESGLPGEKCKAKIPNELKTREQYAETITNFYRSYPADRNVSLLRLLEGLQRDPGLTIEQMHEYYSPSAKGPK